MFRKGQIKLGIAPIAWTNDADMLGLNLGVPAPMAFFPFTG